MELGKKIVKIRKEHQLTQEDFSEKYNVTRQTVSSWENSKSYPDLETIVKISDDFDISLDVLLKEDKKVIENIIKSQKDNKKYKKILIIIGIIIGIFAIINLVWFVGVKSRYIELTKSFNNSKNELGYYTKDIDGYRYIVKDTGYLNHSGFANVSIAKDIVIEFDDEGNEVASDFTKVTLFIWPKWFNGYTYGIDIDYGDYFYQINVDKDGNYIPHENEEQEKLKSLLDDNRDEINKLFDLADKMWDIR